MYMCVDICMSFRRVCISHGLIEGGILFWALTYHKEWHRPYGWATGEKNHIKMCPLKGPVPMTLEKGIKFSYHSVFCVTHSREYIKNSLGEWIWKQK